HRILSQVRRRPPVRHREEGVSQMICRHTRKRSVIATAWALGATLSALPTMQAISQTPTTVSMRKERMVIAVSTALDGRGGVLHDTRIVIHGSEIFAIDANAGPVDLDLRGLTVLPGWIDAHVHITWSFGPDGRNAWQSASTPYSAYAAESNAFATLM